MCGFAAIFSSSGITGRKELVKSMLDTIVYRGPDNRGLYEDEEAIMGFQRLAIIDLQEVSNQPMSDATGRYVITYNGEIYNYRQLRALLEKSGYKFKTRSDTEVLLQLYIDKGESCLQFLNGMFAFVIYDKLERSIFMSRDRAGKKPLFYTFQGNNLYVASELKALLALKDIDKRIDQQMLFQYLALGYNIAPDTVIDKIKKLRPGHFVKIILDKPSDIEQRCFWQISFKNDLNGRSIDDIEEEFFDLLLDSTRLRLQSDVPLALFLSGGLDSSAIASILASSNNESIDAFTVDFDDKQMSEIGTTKALVKKYPNIVHHVLELKVADMIDNSRLLEQLDEPFSDSSFIPTYWISRMVKDAGYTVALSGDGGDELLAGYFKGKTFDLLDAWNSVSNRVVRTFAGSFSGLSILPEKLNDKIRRMSLNKEEYYWYTRSSFKLHNWRSLIKGDVYGEISSQLNYSHLFASINITLEDKMMSVFEKGDFRYRLPDDFLAKVDRASMLSSLEVRNPFLDYRIVELLSKLPVKYKLYAGQTKYILRNILQKRGLVPIEVLEQNKMGFSIPLRNWVHCEMKTTIQDTILSGRCAKWIDPPGLDFFFKTGESLSMHNEFTETIWRIYVLSIYLNRYNLTV
jgi:asparagine synthase (glutamine-hydrolysing)